tara:strand:- start:1928 stop:2680 length:753 start_codon:yes stop_codon:yes gene_type:complete
MKDHLPESPFDSLDKIEASLLSDTKLDNLFSEHSLDKHNPKDKLAMEHMRCWHNQFDWDLINNPKQLMCAIGKIQEYKFTKESVNFDLDFNFHMNWESPYTFDMYLVKGIHEHIPLEFKTQRVTYHPRKNDFNVNYDTFLTLRTSQIPKYCEEGLPYILIDKNLDNSHKTNQKALDYAIRYPWPERKMKLTGGRSLHLVDVETLCKMLDTESNYLQLNIPYYERGKHNGKFTGDTIAFSSELFPEYRIGI